MVRAVRARSIQSDVADMSSTGSGGNPFIFFSTNSSSNHAQRPFPLLNLPFELRLMIYRLVIPTGPIVLLEDLRLREVKFQDVGSLLFVNRQVREEVFKLVYSNISVAVPALDGYRSGISRLRYHFPLAMTVRRVEISLDIDDFYDPEVYQPDFLEMAQNLLLLCPLLRELVVVNQGAALASLEFAISAVATAQFLPGSQLYPRLTVQVPRQSDYWTSWGTIRALQMVYKEKKEKVQYIHPHITERLKKLKLTISFVTSFPCLDMLASGDFLRFLWAVHKECLNLPAYLRGVDHYSHWSLTWVRPLPTDPVPDSRPAAEILRRGMETCPVQGTGRRVSM